MLERNSNPSSDQQKKTGKKSWSEENFLFFRIIVGVILGKICFLLLLYNRNFNVHQDTVTRVLDRNRRAGLFCSKLHVGHKGTTLEFQALPKEVGTAGPIVEQKTALSADPLGLLSFDDYVPLLLLITLCLFLLLVYFIKAKEKNRGKGGSLKNE